MVVQGWAKCHRLTGREAEIAYDDGPQARRAAVVRHNNTRTIGAWRRSLVVDVLARTLSEAGDPWSASPDGGRLSRRGDLAIWPNFNHDEAVSPDGTARAPVSFQIRLA